MESLIDHTACKSAEVLQHLRELALAHDGLDLLQRSLEALQLGDHHGAGVVGASLKRR